MGEGVPGIGNGSFKGPGAELTGGAERETVCQDRRFQWQDRVRWALVGWRQRFRSHRILGFGLHYEQWEGVKQGQAAVKCSSLSATWKWPVWKQETQ